jgi:hypothetical protein
MTYRTGKRLSSLELGVIVCYWRENEYVSRGEGSFAVRQLGGARGHTELDLMAVYFLIDFMA